MYCKYFNDDNRVIEGIFEKNKIRFTQPRELNDPLEFNPCISFSSKKTNPYQPYKFNNKYLPSQEFFYRIHLIELQIDKIGILSLTNKTDSFDMWNLYSNCHKGFVIKFKPNFPLLMRYDNTQNISIIKEVKYVDNYSFNIEKFILKDHSIDNNAICDEMFFIKTSRWKNENEYRMIKPLNENDELINNESKIYLFNFPLDCIDSVIFGTNMSIEKKKKIIKLCKNTKIIFYQSYINRNKLDETGKPGKIIIGKLGYFDSPKLLKLLEIPPQLLYTESSKPEYYEPKSITSLKNLPYFKGNEETVYDLLNNQHNIGK